jgi:steroid 5-alpha reductase family enzyme
MATAFAAPGEVTAIAAAAVAALMLGAWVASLAVRDLSIVDPLWGPAFVLVAVVGVVVGDGCAGRRWLLLGMTAVWGLRLGAYLLARKLADPGEDRRYAAMRERRGDGFAAWSLVAVFALQGLLVVIVSLPLQVAAQRGGTLSATVIPGVAVYAVGLFFESVGDEQLRRFKARADSRGRVMDRGLWRYTRHPNYFGDFCVWWGLWLVALTAGATWWTAIGPLVMTALLLRGSGVAMLERDITGRRPEYAEYVRRTSAFFPLPPGRRDE